MKKLLSLILVLLLALSSFALAEEVIVNDKGVVENPEAIVAGDKEAAAYQDRSANGIEIDDKTLAEVTGIAKRLGIDYAQYVD